METVQELKRLLDFNVNETNPSFSGTSLQTLNSKATKLSNMLEEHLFKETIGTCNNQRSGEEKIANEALSPGIDGTVIKTFEDLVVSKLNDSQLESSMSNGCLTKKSYLKKGEGLKRFSPNNKSYEKTTSVQHQQPSNFRKQKSDLQNFMINTRDRTKKSNNCNECETKQVNRKVISTSNKKNNLTVPKVNKVVRFSDKKQILEPSLKMLNYPSRGDEHSQVESDGINDTYIWAIRAKLNEIEAEEKRLLELITLRNQLCLISHCNGNISKSEENGTDSIDHIKQEIVKLQQQTVSVVDKNSNVVRKEDDNLDEDMTRATASKPMSYSLPNGDQIYFSTDNSLTYKHANGTTQTVFADGLREIHFPNGQIETIQQNGIKQVIYPNGQKRVIKVDNTEEFTLSDGSIITIFPNGIQQIQHLNGDVEIKTKKFTQKKFHNGNLKTIYTNGCEETIYANGRIRFKDRLGNIVYNRIP